MCGHGGIARAGEELDSTERHDRTIEIIEP
jgi:hypothetical protein